MSHESGDGSESVTRDLRNAYKMLKERVTIVIPEENGPPRPIRRAARLRGRDSNPNFLVQSQASYR